MEERGLARQEGEVTVTEGRRLGPVFPFYLQCLWLPMYMFTKQRDLAGSGAPQEESKDCGGGSIWNPKERKDPTSSHCALWLGGKPVICSMNKKSGLACHYNPEGLEQSIPAIVPGS